MQNAILSVDTRNVELTNEELDIIYDALDELRFYDSNNEAIAVIQAKIASLFQS